MLVAFNVTQLAKWGYTNDTLFIDPMQPEFRAKAVSAADNSEEAIRSKVAWFFDTNAYNHGDVKGVESAIDAYKTGGGGLAPSFTNGSAIATQTQNQTQVATQTQNQTQVETTATSDPGRVVTMRPKPWVTIVSTVSTTVIDTMTIVGTYGYSVPTSEAESQDWDSKKKGTNKGSNGW
jgi:bilirubin oxidase